MIILIDGMNIVMRSYHVYQTRMKLQTEAGDPTGAVYGFLRSLIKWARQYKLQKFVVCWDDPLTGSDYRREIYAQYKANRPKGGLGEEGDFQVGTLSQLLESLGVNQAFARGYEADDVIASIARKRSEERKATLIITSDKDMLQLVDDVTVLMTPKGKVYGPERVEEEMGVPPAYLAAYRALDGDASDNIPRVPRMRKKVIQAIVIKYEADLEAMFSDPEGLRPMMSPKEFERLKAFREQAFVNNKLISPRDVEGMIEKEGVWAMDRVKEIVETLEFSETMLQDLQALKRTGFVKTS